MHEMSSLIGSLASLPAAKRTQLISSLSDEEAEQLLWDWKAWARKDQLAPEGDWLTWLILAGRGYGKTRSGAEWVRQEVSEGRAHRIALVAETQKDLEEVMVFGDSGIMSVFPPHQKPIATRKPVRIEFHTGAVAFGYNATEPDQLRGPQFDCAWCDELAKWRYAQETWDMLQFGMRLGNRPRQIVTTTPRPIPLIRDLLKDDTTVVTRGSTYDNRMNLAPSFIKRVIDKYEGTRLGRQELKAEVLDDVPGALWLRSNIDANRVRKLPDMQRIVVAIDPSGTAGDDDDGDDIGIVAAGKGVDGHGYVLADRTCKLSPDGWGRRAIRLFHELEADLIIAERNFGGAMVQHVITTIDKKVPYKEVSASRGKVVRAEPIAALYEQNRVHHHGSFAELEDQMCQFASDGYLGEGSPDRADALVWALTELFFGGRKYGMLGAL